VLRRTRIGALCPVREPDAEPAVEQRTLSDYDIPPVSTWVQTNRSTLLTPAD
jgi:hypothetical protein